MKVKHILSVAWNITGSMFVTLRSAWFLHVGYVRCHRVCLHRVNRAVITFFYVTVATHVTSHDVRVMKTPICTIMQHSTYKSAPITKKSVLISSKMSPCSLKQVTWLFSKLHVYVL